VKRIENDDIVVPSFGDADASADEPGFQREFVWSKVQADRFIESLLLGFPVPGIFLVQAEEGVLLVLDGQQRLRTLQSFYKGVFREKRFKLQSVQEDFRGLTYDDLAPDARRRLDNSIIHATIVRQETPSDDQSGIYKIFERLNTGGTLLQPQEIRVALYAGPLIVLLRDLNQNSQWRDLTGKQSIRLKDQELILRFFALRSSGDKYAAPMKEFLNRYAGGNRTLNREDEAELRSAFELTVDAIHSQIGPRAFRPVRAVNAAVVDSLMTVIDEGLRGANLVENLRDAYQALLEDPDYRLATERATAREENVALRLARSRHHLLV
jgi:hypothetical protein